MRNKPLFVIKQNLQKTSRTGVTFKSQISDEDLRIICEKITGRVDFECKFVENDYKDEFLHNTYNKGRLATLRYENQVHFISFSELAIEGRNSSIQSVPTAFNIFYMCEYANKHLHYYFIAKEGNPFTEYHMFIYRLMMTIGFNFLNFPPANTVMRFVTIEDMMRARDINRQSNRSNNSTYISKNEDGEYEAYCKTYGASKYESSLISYAMSELISGSQKIKLYEIIEGNLKELPQSSKAVLNKMGTVEIIRTDLIFEKSVFDESRGDQLRSPKYQYNLLNKLGSKQCALCGCNIPEIIQGAHVWPVSSIKSANHVNYDDKLKYATDGDNGIWLCENHHKLFDRNMILVSEDGTVKYDTNIPVLYMPYLRDFTKNIMLPKIYLNTNFLNYLSIRNGKLD